MKLSRVSLHVVAALWSVAGLAGAQGVDVPIDPDPMQTIVQNEIHLSLVPGAQPGVPAVLLAAYNDAPWPNSIGLGYSTSTNGGATWTPGQLAYPMNTITGIMMDQAFDPTTAADSQGNLYIGFIAWDQLGYSGMYVARSTNSGATWSPASTVGIDLPPAGVPDPNFRLNDRCQMTTGLDPQTSADNVYVSWIKDRGNDPNGPPYSDIYFSRSTDYGVNYSPNLRINDVGVNHDLANMPVPTVGANGTVYVSWLDYNVRTGGQGTIYLDRSTDGGQTWGADTAVATINLPPLWVNTGGGVVDARAKGAPVIAASPVAANDLYIVYAADPDGIGGDDADIYLIKSTNGGTTWGLPVRVNSDITTSDQILPWIDVKPNGTIDVAWYDRSNDLLDTLWDVFIARSTDGGATFSNPKQLNDSSFLCPLQSPQGDWMGEYLGLAADADHAYVVWTSSVSDSNGDLYFDKIANVNIPEPATASLMLLAGLGLLRRRRG